MRKSVRTFAEFNVDFPDDALWDNEDNLLVPGGRGVAAAIADGLRSRAISCSDAEQYSFYGWRFIVTVSEGAISCILQGGTPWLLICEPEQPMNYEPGAGLAGLVHEILSDVLFAKNILWFTREQYEAGRREGGALTPF